MIRQICAFFLLSRNTESYGIYKFPIFSVTSSQSVDSKRLPCECTIDAVLRLEPYKYINNSVVLCGIAVL